MFGVLNCARREPLCVFLLICIKVYALEQAAQGGGGVPIPGGVQKKCRCGTAGHGLAGTVVLGWWLDLMILGGSSNRNDSMIL